MVKRNEDAVDRKALMEKRRMRMQRFKKNGPRYGHCIKKVVNKRYPDLRVGKKFVRSVTFMLSNTLDMVISNFNRRSDTTCASRMRLTDVRGPLCSLLNPHEKSVDLAGIRSHRAFKQHKQEVLDAKLNSE